MRKRVRNKLQDADDETLDKIIQCFIDGRNLRENREELGYRSELVIASLHQRLNSLYEELVNTK